MTNCHFNISPEEERLLKARRDALLMEFKLYGNKENGGIKKESLFKLLTPTLEAILSFILLSKGYENGNESNPNLHRAARFTIMFLENSKNVID